MTEGECASFLERSRIRARYLGFRGVDIEDISQEAVLLMVSHGKGKTLDYAVVDAVRMLFGRPKTKGRGYKRKRGRPFLLVTDPDDLDVINIPQDHKVLEFREILNPLNPSESRFLILKFIYGWNNAELSKHYGYSAPTVALWCERIYLRLGLKLIGME